MEILIKDRYSAQDYVASHGNQPLAVISISGGWDSKPEFKESVNHIIHYSEFNDVLEGYPGFITIKQAVSVAGFILTLPVTTHTLLVHCQQGVSRSAAVAAAIMTHFTNDASSVFDNTKYTPNQDVYQIVLEALTHVSKKEKG